MAKEIESTVLREALSDHKALKLMADHFEKTPAASFDGIDPRYNQDLGATNSSIRLKESSDLSTHIKSVDTQAASAKKATEGKAHEDIITRAQTDLKKAGAKAHTEIDAAVDTLKSFDSSLEEAYKAADNSLAKKHLGDPAKYLEQKAALDKEFETLKSQRKVAGEILDGHRTKVSELSGISSKGESVAVAAGKAAKGATITAEEYAKKSKFWGKPIESMKANFRNEKLGWKAARVAGAGVGAIIVISGLKDLARFVGAADPKKDAEGKEIPVGGGTLVKSLVELGAGAGIAVASLSKGGHAKIVLGK